jgi:hypothetical protein
MENNNTPKKRFYFGLLLPFLFRPRATAPKIAQKRATWLTPLLIVSLLVIIRVLVATPVTSAIAPTEMTPPANQGPKGLESETQLVSAQTGGGGGGGEGGEETPVPGGEMPVVPVTPSPLELTLPAAGAVVSLWVGWFLLSVLLYVGMVVSGSNNTFTETLNLTGWSGLPLGLRQIPLIIAGLALPAIAANPAGLASLATSLTGPTGTFLTVLLKMVDFYLIWQMVLIMLSLKQVSPLSTGRVVTITLGAMLIFLVLASMPGFLGSIFAQLTQPVPGYY